ncbi:uncharacterized protein [Dermacentor albipictus]
MPTFPTLSACMGHWDCWQASVAMLAARGLTRLLLYFWASEIYRERHPGTPQTAEAIYGWCCRIVANADPLASTALASLPVLGPYEYAETHAVLAAIVMVVTLCVLAAAAYLKVMVEKDDGTCSEEARSSKDELHLPDINGTRPPFPTVSSCLAHWGSREAWVATLVARGSAAAVLLGLRNLPAAAAGDTRASAGDLRLVLRDSGLRRSRGGHCAGLLADLWALRVQGGPRCAGGYCHGGDAVHSFSSDLP